MTGAGRPPGVDLGGQLSRVELVLVNGATRTLELPPGTGSMANALARLDDWVQTSDGGWVQKRHIVEVRAAGAAEEAGTRVEYEALDAAASAIVDGGTEEPAS